MEFKKNDVYEAEITGLTVEGNGVCKLDGYTVFVPVSAVGDRALVKLLKVNKNYGYGRIEKLITPSHCRIQNNCPAYPVCGGCSFRHISYKAELEAKEEIVRSAFERIGGIKPLIESIIGGESTSGYRNKAQYPFGIDKEGRITAGFFAKRSHRVVPCEKCDLQPDIFSEILRFVLDFADKNKIMPYDPQNGKGILRTLYLRRSETRGEIMACIVAAKEIPEFYQLAKELKGAFPEISGVVLNINPENTNVILGDKYKVLWGADYITDRVCGVDLRVSAASFFQVNRKQAERLYEKAKEYAGLRGEETVLDLYCGTGAIGLSMADKIKKLIGAEIVPEAVENAKYNALANGINNAEFICADASEAAARLAEEGIKPDVVLLDPPRKGCDSKCIEAVCKMAPDRVVMISCNPATAARDCAAFESNGYKAVTVTPVDMFPRTSHVECVTLMSRV